MNVYLIRHADAGSRGPGGRDLYRPLSERGVHESEALASALSDLTIGAVLSSPATRCIQTVLPLAKGLGLSVGEEEAFWEDALITDAAAVVEKHAHSGVAVSSHGNIIPELLRHYSAQGTKLSGRGCAKASVWTLTWEKGSFSEARYATLDQL